MLGVVMDPRHDVGPAEALRILERRVGDELAGFEIDQPEHDGGGAEVDREAVDRTGRAGDSSPVIASTMRSPSRTTADRAPRLAAGRKVERVPLDAHLAAAHRVALDLAGRRRDAALARQPERPASRCRSTSVGGVSRSIPSRDLDDALLALALGDAGRGDADAGLLGGIEERHAAGDVDACPLMVSVTASASLRAYQSASASSSASTASRDVCAGAARSCSSLHCHWAR